jgi:uncharacterized protein
VIKEEPEYLYHTHKSPDMIGYLTKEQSEALLAENTFGRIGCNDGFNTYVYPSNYIFDGKFIYCHSLAGARISIMRNNKRVCFQVDAINDVTNWKSVMVLGDYEELNDERNRYYAMKAFNEKSLHIKISKSILPSIASEKGPHPNALLNSRPVIYRISLDEITGRYEKE